MKNTEYSVFFHGLFMSTVIIFKIGSTIIGWEGNIQMRENNYIATRNMH